MLNKCLYVLNMLSSVDKDIIINNIILYSHINDVEEFSVRKLWVICVKYICLFRNRFCWMKIMAPIVANEFSNRDQPTDIEIPVPFLVTHTTRIIQMRKTNGDDNNIN